MMPSFDGVGEYAQWTQAVVGSLYGLVRFLAGRKETEQENADTIECHEHVLETLSDADVRAKIELHTGKKVDEQLSVEEVMAIQEDLERRKVWPKNN